ncbi:hypothetical protein Hanom_Chr15g01406511 [Helianthus anomalus]
MRDLTKMGLKIPCPSPILYKRQTIQQSKNEKPIQNNLLHSQTQQTTNIQHSSNQQPSP